MSNEAQITLTGNATGDAELRFTQSGAAVANVTVAVTPREKNGDQWQDGQAAFYRVAAWRDMAENVAESVRKGDRVTVVGRLKPREYEHNGEKRMSLDVDADSVALDLRFRTAKAGPKPQRVQHSNPQGYQQANDARQQADPWAGQPQQQTWGGAGNASHDEPPF